MDGTEATRQLVGSGHRGRASSSWRPSTRPLHLRRAVRRRWWLPAQRRRRGTAQHPVISLLAWLS